MIRQNVKNQNKRSRNNKKVIGVVVVLVLVIGGLIAWWAHHSNKPAPAVATNSTPTTTSSTPESALSSPKPTPTPNVPGGTTGKDVGSTATLTAPSGQFVNNHGSNTGYPVQSDTQEVSACTTTPGASCTIQFSKDGVTKSLPSQTASAGGKDSQDGTTSWTWTPGDVGLTPGDWTITAVASLNGQTKSTPDSIKLTVSP